MLQQSVIAGLLSGVLAMSGCVSAEKPNSGPFDGGSAIDRTFSAAEPINRPAPMRSARVLIEVAQCGAVPYDNMTLPLLSPDGRFIATQVGIAPTWAMTLAEHDAEPPTETRVEVYALDRSERQPQYQFTVDADVVLGRSSDSDGFLVESPQADGSRWIGKVGWREGSIQWLVADDHVNAFAALGPEGRLAWSRRPVADTEDQFDLVVRQGESEWSMEARGESWFMPNWSGRGDALFVLTITGDRLTANYGMASRETAFRQSRRRLDLATGANVYSAYQALIGQAGARPVAAAAPTDELVFHHPSLMRMAIWRPMAGQGRSLVTLTRQSFGALTDGSDLALVSTDEALIQQSLQNLRAQSEVIAGIHVPRRIVDPQWPYVLLAPAETRIGVMFMRPTTRSAQALR